MLRSDATPAVAVETPDLSLSGMQPAVYEEALTSLLSSSPHVHVITAGAGSGKTRLLCAVGNALLANDVRPNEVTGISFTNASANDMRKKFLGTQKKLKNDVVNISFSTVHQHAANLITSLSPHIAGLSYLSEFHNDNLDDKAMFADAVRLGLFASVYYGSEEQSLLKNVQLYSTDKRAFVLDEWDPSLEDDARQIIEVEQARPIGLGAFTASAHTDPSYPIAVAIDALMRLKAAGHPKEGEDMSSSYGIPKYILFDECQDADILQMMYIRALSLNGTSILMVGDPRQTLYRWRYAVGQLPFDQQFMNAFYKGTAVIPVIGQSMLCDNYRSKYDIVITVESFMSGLNKLTDNELSNKEYKNLSKIINPDSIARGVPHNKDGMKAVRCIVGGSIKKNTKSLLSANTITTASNKKKGGALSILTGAKSKSNGHDQTMASILEESKYTGRLAKLIGGKNTKDIQNAIVDLSGRASMGETCCILTTVNLCPPDWELLSDIISKSRRGSEVQWQAASGEMSSALSSCWLLDEDQGYIKGYSVIDTMVAVAMNFFLAASADTWSQYKDLDVRFPKFIISAPFRDAGNKNKPEIKSALSIAIKYYVELILEHVKNYPRNGGKTKKVLIDLCADFLYRVLLRYAHVYWETFHTYQLIPCTLRDSIVEFRRETKQTLLRPFEESSCYISLFLRALVSTPLRGDIFPMEDLRDAQLPIEYVGVNNTLSSLIRAYVVWGEAHGNDNDARLQGVIDARENSYHQFSIVYCKKTKVLLKGLAQDFQSAVRADPDAPLDAIRTMVFEERFKGAFEQTQIRCYSHKGALYGALHDQLHHQNDIKLTKNNANSSTESGISTITLSTVYSSKGLEWDNVIYFSPAASSYDKTKTLTECRDITYVAMTRARNTLTVVIPNKTPLTETTTSFKFLNYFLNKIADENGYFNREIEYPAKAVIEEEKKGIHIYDETSHSELEKAENCRLEHFFVTHQYKPIAPLPLPAYSFFFHSVMSGLAAYIAGLRVPFPDDPVIDIGDTIIDIIEKDDGVDEESVFSIIYESNKWGLRTLVEVLAPMYLSYEGGSRDQILTFYAEALAHHISGIIKSSSLFKILLHHRHNKNIHVYLEKSQFFAQYYVPHNLEMGCILPLMGRPDVQIITPDEIYTYDYKTSPDDPLLYDEDSENLISERDFQLRISQKTHTQMVFYQNLARMAGYSGRRQITEMIYVRDVSIMGQDIPDTVQRLPWYEASKEYSVRTSEHAQVLWSIKEPEDDEIKGLNLHLDEIISLRENCDDPDKEFVSSHFTPKPLVGELQDSDVSIDQCKACGSNIHCPKSKHYSIDPED